MRLALSIKQLEADPLLETLDTLMPVESQVRELLNTRTNRASKRQSNGVGSKCNRKEQLLRPLPVEGLRS